MLKPIHADVLLRIESTNSESSRGDQPEQPKARTVESHKKIDLIEKTSAVELIKAEEQQSLTIKDQIDSNDEGIYCFDVKHVKTDLTSFRVCKVFRKLFSRQ